jgi:hypothetical protein
VNPATCWKPDPCAEHALRKPPHCASIGTGTRWNPRIEADEGMPGVDAAMADAITIVRLGMGAVNRGAARPATRSHALNG